MCGTALPAPALTAVDVRCHKGGRRGGGGEPRASPDSANGGRRASGVPRLGQERSQARRAEPRLHAWLPALLPTCEPERTPSPGRARSYTTQAIVHGVYTAGGRKTSSPPSPRGSGHVVLRARQAAESSQGPRRALRAAGLHIPIPPVTPPRRCGRSLSHGYMPGCGPQTGGVQQLPPTRRSTERDLGPRTRFVQ